MPRRENGTRDGGIRATERDHLAELAGQASADAAIASAGTARPTSLSAPTDLTAAAFFDVDNTMMVGASIFHFARGLAARKYFSTADLAG
ncbi:MAG TPA: HAD-IB family hydrolase, partial [Pseudonocardiaceae bacterium]